MGFSHFRPLRHNMTVVAFLAVVVAAMTSPIAMADIEDGSDQAEAMVGSWRGAYLPHGWIAAPRPADHITEAVRDLDRMKMNIQIHNIGAMDSTGSVPSDDYPGLDRWIEVSRQVEPAHRMVLWVSGDTAVHVEHRPLHDAMAAWLASLVGSTDAYGVLLDLEPFRPDDPDLVALLDGIRAKLPDTWIGLTAPPDDRWSSRYLTALSSRVDGISPLLYDTSLSEPADYRHLIATQVTRYQKAAGPRAMIVPSLPSYAASPWHDPATENIAEAMGALYELDEPLDGAAVYWWWEFTEESRRSWLEGPAADGTFTDDNGNIFEGAIEAIAAEGMTQGCNPPANDEFCPDDFVDRGEMAVFLVRAFEYPGSVEGDLFADDNGEFYENAAERLRNAGITLGCNPPIDDRYCGDRPVTRGQMAAFLVRALGLDEDGGNRNLYVDDDGSVFERAIDRLGTSGITQGCNPPANDRFCPEAFVTRGQMAAFLTRALGLSATTDH